MKQITTELFTKATELVKEKITGHRKGMPDSLNWEHSLRVSQALKQYGFDEVTQLAGLLHDVYEDGDMSFEELEQLFPKEVIDLVRLCSHDREIADRDLRWVLMIINLVKADNKQAWAIKLADVSDNVNSSEYLKPERARFMKEVKIPVLLESSKHVLQDTDLWKDLASKVS